MSDLISRQAAIDRINKQREHLQPDVYPQDEIGDAAYRICSEFIERLPSTQPEIIRCKDCKDYQEGFDIDGKPFSRCNGSIRTYGQTSPNWFCADAERKNE